MHLEIFVEKEFNNQAKRLSKKYRSLKNDLKVFRESLQNNPLQGTDLGNGVKKVRMAIVSKGKGKSGGVRVITYSIRQNADSIQIDLLIIYDKNEMPNVSDDFIKYLLQNRDNLKLRILPTNQYHADNDAHR